MAMKDIKSGKLLYHLTKLSNLDSILENGLVSRKIIIEENAKFDDVADPGIISKRTELGLDKYIPFHFHPYSSFDVAVKSRFNNDEFIYICLSRSLAIENDFKILIKHPLTVEDCILMNYDEGFDKIDWDSMHTYGTESDYTKHVKMAECITDLVVPAKFFQSIAVRNNESKAYVEQKLVEYEIVDPPFVDVKNWF